MFLQDASSQPGIGLHARAWGRHVRMPGLGGALRVPRPVDFSGLCRLRLPFAVPRRPVP